VAALSRLAAASPGDYLPELAASLDSLSLRLSEAGRQAEAMAAAERAGGMYERPAEGLRDRLRAQVFTRLAEFAESGFRDTILSDNDLMQVCHLLLTVDAAAPDVEVANGAGLLLWSARMPDEADWRRDRQGAAESLLGPVYLSSPDLLPGFIRQGFDDNPPTSTWFQAGLSILAMLLLHRPDLSDNPVALVAAAGLTERAVAATPDDDPDRAGLLVNLGAALEARFMRSGHPRDLDRAVAVREQALAALPEDRSERIGLLVSLGAALQARFEHSGQPGDLDRAVAVREQALAATPADDAVRAGRLTELSNSLERRFESSGQLADLNRAAELGEQAVASSHGDDQERAVLLSNLSGVLWRRSERTGDIADLNRAVELGEQAVAADPTGDPELAGMLSQLGQALSLRFERTGAMADLNRAAETSERALAATPVHEHRRASRLSNLGRTLQRRFNRTGELADLNRAVEVGEEAVATAAAGHPERPRYLSNLSAALRMRYMRTGELADLNRAVDVGEQAAATVAEGHHERLAYLSTLGTVLDQRFARTGELADLNRALEVGEQALAATAADHPGRGTVLSNVGLALQRRFAHTGEVADINRAVDLGGQAVAATSPDHPLRAGMLYNLGLALELRFERAVAHDDMTRAVIDLIAAIEDSLQAAQTNTAPPSLRASAAHMWGRLAARWQDWASAIDGYATAISLLPLVAPRGLGRGSQEHELSRLMGLGSDAAACCLQAGQVEQAVELWEQGRGVLFGQALDTRTDISVLAERHPQLASRFTDIRDELDGVTGLADDLAAVVPGVPLPVGGGPAATARAAADRRRELAERLDEVIAEIRALPGFDRFMLPQPFSELQRAADQGPVVLVNVSGIRSDAIILTSGGVEVVPLSELRPAAVRDQAVALFSALGDAQHAAAQGTRDEAEARLSQQLRWLWDSVTGPVLEQLGVTGIPGADQPWPRVWWCPSGLLAFLPLHAAGDHCTRFEPAARAVLDRAVSSYTPTIRALIHARRTGTAEATDTGSGRAVVVVMPHTPGAGDLPGAAAEAALISELLAGQVLLLDGQQATNTSVAAVLPRFPWAHFACHGTSDAVNPSASRLLLHDHEASPPGPGPAWPTRPSIWPRPSSWPATVT
jgi:tetratricopeptide (TPR) repeat protein